MRALENRVATALRWRIFPLASTSVKANGVSSEVDSAAAPFFFASRRASLPRLVRQMPLDRDAFDRELAAKRDRLLAAGRGYGSCAVAFSGGVDSTVVAKAAQLALGDRAVAVTGTSASLAAGELDEARRLAALIGIRHEVIDTEEFASADYRRNASRPLLTTARPSCTRSSKALAERLGVAVIVNGANLDDRGDYRPGMTGRRPSIASAARWWSAASRRPTCGDWRPHWELPVWDKPASPCLSSRVAYGEEVTPERVAMIDRAEQYLRGLGLRELRVRYHKGDLARIEVPVEEIAAAGRPGSSRASWPRAQAARLQVRDARPRRLSLRQPEPGAADRSQQRRARSGQRKAESLRTASGNDSERQRNAKKSGKRCPPGPFRFPLSSFRVST